MFNRLKNRIFRSCSFRMLMQHQRKKVRLFSSYCVTCWDADAFLSPFFYFPGFIKDRTSGTDAKATGSSGNATDATATGKHSLFLSNDSRKQFFWRRICDIFFFNFANIEQYLIRLFDVFSSETESEQAQTTLTENALKKARKSAGKFVAGFFQNLASLGQKGSDSEEDLPPRPRIAQENPVAAETTNPIEPNKATNQERAETEDDRPRTAISSSHKGSDAFLLPHRNKDDERE